MLACQLLYQPTESERIATLEFTIEILPGMQKGLNLQRPGWLISAVQ